jgi:uncharacterized membrane protein YgaE (UPF0421/DUF939 family)
MHCGITRIWERNLSYKIGTMASEYEIILAKLLAEKKSRLDELLKDPERNKVEIAMLSTELESLESLIENYNLGMNVFRRAQGGRSALRE